MKFKRHELEGLPGLINYYLPEASVTVHYSPTSKKYYLALNDNYTEIPLEIVKDIGNVYYFIKTKFPEEFI
jgi:hypothetical protein